MLTGVTGVVGAGPRTLSALVALDQALDEADLGPLRVEVWDPSGPGGGVWDLDLPEHLVLNVASTILDLSGPSVPHDYTAWAQTEGLVAATYPPRAWVGRYLRWVGECVAASPRLALRFHRERVHSLEPVGDRWRVHPATGGQTQVVDHVLLATGHRGGAGLDHQMICSDLDRFPADGTVRILGAALTAYDVVLDLTQGRGGTWAPEPAAASGLRYEASGAEPAVIELVSRSGLLLTPKPDAESPGARAAGAQVAEVLRSWRCPDATWWATLWQVAVRMAAESGVSLATSPPVEILDREVDPCDPWQRWARDLRRAAGELDADPAWWWGRAWSAAYPAIVAGLEREPRDSEWWPRWRHRAARLERWAFGPPSQTVRRLLALAEAGRVRVVAAGESDDRAAGGAWDLEAVIAGPGVLSRGRRWADGEVRSPDPLWDDLLRRGVVTVRPGERGVFTLPDGQCCGRDATPTPGLWALGRPTEDPVIGHDTLSRTLHGDAQRWAQRMVEGLARGLAGGHEEGRDGGHEEGRAEGCDEGHDQGQGQRQERTSSDEREGTRVP